MLLLKNKKLLLLGLIILFVNTGLVYTDPTHNALGSPSFAWELIKGCLIPDCFRRDRYQIDLGDHISSFDFVLQDESGKRYKLSDMLGKKIALVFYVKDQSAECIRQLCNIRDNYAALQAAGIVVWGINDASLKSHKAFNKQYKFPFPLLSDSKKRVIKSIGAKRVFGHNKRITILIDEEGYVIAVLKNIDIAHHTHQIIRQFEKSISPGSIL